MPLWLSHHGGALRYETAGKRIQLLLVMTIPRITPPRSQGKLYSSISYAWEEQLLHALSTRLRIQCHHHGGGVESK
jgi:hypothetical protein